MTESAPELPLELTAELVVDSAVPAQPVISPDGRWVAYAVAPTGKRGERRLSALWLAAADASSPPRQLTAATAADSAPRWAPDSAALFFVSDRTGSAQLHRIRLDGGEAEALTAWRGGINGHYPLACGQVVAVLAADEPTQEDERRKAERDDAVVWGEQVPWSRLRLLDLETGELRVVDGIGDRHVVELAQRPDGGPLAVLSWGSPDIDPGVRTAGLQLADPETAAVRDLGPAGLEAQSPAWWHDGDSWHLAYLAAPRLLCGTAIYDASLPASGQAGEHRSLTEGMPVCPVELAQVSGGPLLEAALGGSCGWEGTGPHPHDRVSPVSFASKVRTPVLIVHGEDDTNVPLSPAIFFHRALSQFGAEHELVVYPREGHGFTERNHQIDLLRRTRAWFGRWLGDLAQPSR